MKINYKEFLPILILNLIVFFSIVKVLISEYIFGIKHFIGLGLLVISTVLFFINKKGHICFFGVALILGILGFVGFSVIEVEFKISTIKINLVPFVIFLLYIYVFSDDFKKMKTNRNKKESEELQKSFKIKFGKLSDKEIDLKLKRNLTAEAMNALKEIKIERVNESR